MAIKHVYAPFTPTKVKNLNDFQRSGYFHPFTCPDCSASLTAMEMGWRCLGCGEYTQDWAHKMMADGSALAAYRKLQSYGWDPAAAPAAPESADE